MAAAVLSVALLAASLSTVVAMRDSQTEDLDLDVEMRVAPLLHFYIYRATSAKYPPKSSEGERSVSFGNVAGVLHYIHSAVIGRLVVDTARQPTCQRKGDIDRIVRYKATMKSTDAAVDKEASGFLDYMPIEKGECTQPRCLETFQTYGFVPGCAKPPSDSLRYDGAVWYSFPGRCPSKSYDEACSNETLKDEPGGACKAPDGTANCTYTYEPAGEVLLDDLVGIKRNYSDYAAFCAAGGVEANGPSDNDTGVTIDFWKNYSDIEANRRRVASVLAWFNIKYNMTSPLDDPACKGPQSDAIVPTTTIQTTTSTKSYAPRPQAWLPATLLAAVLLHRHTRIIS